MCATLSINKGKSKGKWMYGLDRREDHNAIKVAANELKSAIAILAVRPSNLCPPLITLVLPPLPLPLPLSLSLTHCVNTQVDYRGFRLTAESMLPINKEQNTLVYGSADQGRVCIVHTAMHSTIA